MLTEHGVKIAPSIYYAALKRPRSARAVRDILVLEAVRHAHGDREAGRGLYGARKVWHHLRRAGGVQGRPVPRCQVERLMRAEGLLGARRGRRFVTTRPDPAAGRAPDLVQRDFTAKGPNQLWLVDFTYVPTWSGMVFTAFVSDAIRTGRRSGRAGRPAMRSPGRPPVARREDRQRFWAAVARGLSSEDAAVSCGVSPAVGSRWFRVGGGMPSIRLAPASGRYLSECASLKWPHLES